LIRPADSPFGLPPPSNPVGTVRRGGFDLRLLVRRTKVRLCPSLDFLAGSEINSFTSRSLRMEKI